MRATLAADDTKHFFYLIRCLVFSFAWAFWFNAMCDDVACLFWNRFYFCAFGFFFVVEYFRPKCAFKNNLVNIKFVYLDAHYLAARCSAQCKRDLNARIACNAAMSTNVEFSFNYQLCNEFLENLAPNERLFS